MSLSEAEEQKIIENIIKQFVPISINNKEQTDWAKGSTGKAELFEDKEQPNIELIELDNKLNYND